MRSMDIEADKRQLELISERLADYAVRYELMHDSRAIFTRTYSIMTQIIAQQVEQVKWEDVGWIVGLAGAFSSRYFAALDAYDSGWLRKAPNVRRRSF
jgi:Family of unknown function (DUF5995)